MQYFVDKDGNLKYPYEKPKYGYGAGGTEYFPYLNFPGNESIPTISGGYLGPAVINGLSSIPDCNSSEKKVIIITHSFGGLATKSLLKRSTNWQDHISKIIFVDTPHKGSPYASMLWVLKEVTDNKLPPLIKNNLFHSTPSGTLKSSLGLIDKENIARWHLANQLAAEKDAIDDDLFILNISWPVCFNIDARGKAIEELRLPNDVSYYKLFEAEYDNVEVTEPVSEKSEGSTTFLAHENDYLTMPDPSKTKTFIISAQQDNSENDREEELIKKYETKYIPSLTFPSGESLDDVKNSGDGIVSLFSQRNGSNNADFNITAFHTKATEIVVDEILQAIEDKPVIESVRAVPVDWNKPNKQSYSPSSYEEYYLIFKVKDYLLADIEIESLTIDTYLSVDLSMFEVDGKYKPYNYRRDEKAFLKERDDTSATFKNIKGEEEYLKDLKPGEFWVKATIPANATQVKLRIRNPAAEYDAESFTAERTFYIKRPRIANIDWGPYWSAVPGILAFIDVPPYDYSPLYDGKGNIIVLHYYPSSASRYLDLSFSIKDSPYSEVRCNAWLYNANFETVWKKFCTDKGVPPLSGSPYSGVVNDIPRWHGDKEGGGYIEGYDVFNTDYEHAPGRSNTYRLKVTVETTNDDPKDDILPLLGLSLYGDYRGTILCADPTFIQASRREGVSW
ncbi:MAG: hypothetical protein ABH847_03045 [Candidatus Omnitrophota bacterium]